MRNEDGVDEDPDYGALEKTRSRRQTSVTRTSQSWHSVQHPAKNADRKSNRSCELMTAS